MLSSSMTEDRERLGKIDCLMSVLKHALVKVNKCVDTHLSTVY